MDKYTKLDSSGKPLTPGVLSLLDSSTGLIWTAADVGDRMTFAEAEKAVAALKAAGHGGFTDWRLPTIKELLTLVDYDKHDPAADPVLDLKSAYYWSSSPFASSPSVCAWIVLFDDGGSGCSGRDFKARFRAVRSASPAVASQ